MKYKCCFFVAVVISYLSFDKSLAAFNNCDQMSENCIHVKAHIFVCINIYWTNSDFLRKHGYYRIFISFEKIDHCGDCAVRSSVKKKIIEFY